MNTYEYKLSIGIRIDSISPTHVHFTIFSNMIPVEQEHEQATRAMAGKLCLRVEEYNAFIERLQPDLEYVPSSENTN